MKLTKNLVTIPTALQIGARKRSFTANLWSLTTHTYRVMIIVTGDFSKKSFFVTIFRSNCSSKQVLLGILQYSQYSQCSQYSQYCNISTLSKKRLQVKITKFLWTAFFMEHLWWLLLSVWFSLNQKQNMYDGFY